MNEAAFRETVVSDTSHFSLHDFPVDHQAIAASVLNIDGKERSNLFPWNGQFSPQFVEAILLHYTRPGMRVYDPFCGSGTVLCEAGRLNLSAVGSEVNPAAFLLARVYTLMRLPPKKRLQLVSSLEQPLADFAGPDCVAEADVRELLLELAHKVRGDTQVVAEALVILSDFYKGVSSERVWKSWLKLRRVIVSLPFTTASIDMELRDCRSPEVSTRMADLILTSPPYINVYNYHQQYRASAEALGWNLLSVAKSEIGSNRKHRANRFYTVVQYCLDMAENLRSVKNIVADKGRIIMILGRESRVRGVPFFNGEIIARLGIECAGYTLLQRQERVFTNRFGQRIVEDILHLGKGRESSKQEAVEQHARQIALDTLNLAKKCAKGDVSFDLENAISAVNEISASPVFGQSQDYRQQRTA